MQETKIHGFIPTKCADQHEHNLRLGKLCIIKDFTVQNYKKEERFRPVQNDKHIIFLNDTKLEMWKIKESNSRMMRLICMSTVKLKP